jgi:anti-sigma factor RsiW
MPVVQLAYVDPNGQLFAFCFMPNRSGETKPRRPQRVGDLTMIDWSDAKFQYVVVGYGSVQALSDIAERLQRSYRLDA